MQELARHARAIDFNTTVSAFMNHLYATLAFVLAAAWTALLYFAD